MRSLMITAPDFQQHVRYNAFRDTVVMPSHKFLTRQWVEQKTKQLQVVPVSKSLNAEMKTMPYELAEEIIKNSPYRLKKIQQLSI